MPLIYIICLLLIIFIINKDCYESFNPYTLSPIYDKDSRLNLKNVLGTEKYELIMDKSKDKGKIVTSVTIPKEYILDYDKNTYISDYDNIELKTTDDSCDSWRRIPTDLPLIDDKILLTHVGNQIPLKTELTNQEMRSSGPSLDGTLNTPNRMFMFSNNISSPLCCPSTLTTSTGCVCSTKEQRDFISSRGLPSP